MTTYSGVTAWTVARMRAKHQIVDQAAIFADPFALSILSTDGREMLYEPEAPPAMRLPCLHGCAEADRRRTVS